MEPPFTLINCRIAILGLGLMGGSLAMALKGKASALYGADPDPRVIELALHHNLLDLGFCSPSEAAAEADLIVLAAPVNSILSLIKILPDLHPGSPVVLDLGSTKQQITAAMAELPSRFEPIGGHPMCGKEKSGLENASANLYQNAPFALTILPRTTPRAQSLAEQLILAVGARPVLVEAQEHDQWAAATSHLPYLVACALTNATPPQVQPLVGPGFRSTSRVAAASSQVMLDILSTNTIAVLEALARYRQEIDLLEELLENNDWKTLASTLERAARRQVDLVGERT
jgi:prephenate dehydrogenase